MVNVNANDNNDDDDDVGTFIVSFFFAVVDQRVLACPCFCHSEFVVTTTNKTHKNKKQNKTNKTKKEIIEAWTSLKTVAAQRLEQLANAHEIHAFNRDADEIASRIAEKDATLSSGELGKELASVEALQRKHDGFARDLAALGDSVHSLGEEAKRLTATYPEHSSQIRGRQEEIETSWQALTSKAQSRKKKLDESYELQRFLNDVRNSQSWIQDMKALLSADELAKDVAGSDSLLQRHQEHKGEIDARQDSFKTVTDFGNALISRGHYASTEIQERLDTLAAARADLLTLWQERKELFDQCHDLQLLLRDAEQIEGWIAAQEATLANDDLGDSLDSVDALLKKQDDFEKSLAAQEEKTKAWDDFAQSLISYSHYDIEAISARRDALLGKRDNLDQLSADRRTKLERSREFQQFKRDVDEAHAWIAEKMQTASDESYRDPTNLRGKLQNHQAFDAELAANEGRISTVSETGQSLVASGHYAAAEIESLMQDLTAEWTLLRKTSADKVVKLKEANQTQQFSRRVEDIEEWCAEVQTTLGSDDLGKDLTSVQNLLKKHNLLEAEIAGYDDRIKAVQKQAAEFVAAGHFQAPEIQAKEQSLSNSYAALAEPAAARRALLEDSLRLQQVLLACLLACVKKKDVLCMLVQSVFMSCFSCCVKVVILFCL